MSKPFGKWSALSDRRGIWRPGLPGHLATPQSHEFLDILLRDCEEREVNVSVTRFEHKEDGIVTYRPISGRDTLEDRRLIGVEPRR